MKRKKTGRTLQVSEIMHKWYDIKTSFSCFGNNNLMTGNPKFLLWAHKCSGTLEYDLFSEYSYIALIQAMNNYADEASI